jgi:hypothetical protein
MPTTYRCLAFETHYDFCCEDVGRNIDYKLQIPKQNFKLLPIIQKSTSKHSIITIIWIQPHGLIIEYLDLEFICYLEFVV